jgi:hypothetical protein
MQHRTSVSLLLMGRKVKVAFILMTVNTAMMILTVGEPAINSFNFLIGWLMGWMQG